MIVNPELEHLDSAPDFREFRRAYEDNALRCRTIGRRGRSVRREAALLCTEGAGGRATIFTANTDTEARYFEGGAESTVWVPWAALPDRARQQGFRLVSENNSKTAYYERPDEARMRLPDGILEIVSGGGLFQRRSVPPKSGPAVPELDVHTGGPPGEKETGKPQALRILLNPMVFALDTMTRTREKENGILAKIATEAEVDFHPELAPADWLRTRIHASLAREWVERPARGSVMLSILFGPKAGTGRRPWEMAFAFPALDALHGQFDVRLEKAGTMEIEWRDGEAADGDPLVAYAGEVLGAKLGPGKAGIAVPEESMPGETKPAQVEESEFKSVMETYLDATRRSLAGLAARVGKITDTERKILENELEDVRDRAQDAIGLWCKNHVQPRSRIGISLPEPPAWIGDTGWSPDARVDPRGGDRRDLPRSRAAMWWLRLLEPDNEFDEVEGLEAHGPRWKSQFFVWLFRGRDANIPQWEEPQERTRGRGNSWGRLSIDLVLGERVRQRGLSGPELPDWPTVLD